ncbi:MAG: antitoxin MazE family protein [Pseudonocardiaceae bacterium]
MGVRYRALHVTWRMAEPDRTRVHGRVRAHRARLRAQGLRPIQIWVPDVRSPTFVAEAHQQSVVVTSSGHANDDQTFIDAISWDGE